MLRSLLRHHVELKHCRQPSKPSYRSFHASPSPRIFGISLPTPSNEPLAGTVGGDGVPILFLFEVIVGLPTVLWIYKCLMLVAMQRKIIYLPSVPPGTRHESLANEERTKDRLHWI
ncbi:uncharacterized protein JCM6883_002258 [Sporobolomyces salmoneus]|uniref:uncharacterized protein n=1 Tax=Sporobolomyces salmoneus TaxID=183962 RepID=UPI00316CBC9B